MQTPKISRTSTLVSFSGIDGAGKSTLIANLIAHLEQSGLRVRLITFWDDVARLKFLREGAGHTLFKGDKGVGTPEAPIQRRDKNVRSPLMTLVRLALYAIDAVSLRRVVKRAMRSDAHVVIFDRYMYDELANLNLRNPAMRAFARTIMMLVPRPEPGFVIDTDPAQAHARKPEYPLDFLYSNRESYLKLAQILDGITVLPNTYLERAKADVVTEVMHRLPPPGASDGATNQSAESEVRGVVTR